MNQTSAKYPALASLILIVTALGKDFAAQGETLMQKFEASASLIPQGLAFLGQASNLSAELTAIKASPQDEEQAVELIVADLGFTSEKVKNIIAKAEPVAQQVVALFQPVADLIASIKA